VLLLHGYTASGKLQDFYFGMSRRVNDFGFILLIPDGIKNSKSIRFWNATDFCCDIDKSNVDDSGYLQALVEKVKFEYRVDPRRVYIIGHSNGGFMANRLACDTQGVFAGIASFAGGTYKDLSKCINQDALPYLHIQAENDPVVAWKDDKRFLTGAETVDYWVKRNGCASRPEDEGTQDLILTIPKSDTEVFRWEQCRNGADVVLWKIRSYASKIHRPHTPLLKREFSDGMLKFLLNYRRD
jgi:polyhydroxybutyrate depolymerase